MEILVLRDYKNHHTDGEVFVDGERFCYCLEDIGRPEGVKIPEETCIPEGVYGVAISRSTRWHKDMLILCTDGTTPAIKVGDVEWTGIRPHGGNTIADTHGCPLLAYHSDLAGKIWDRASDDLFYRVMAAIDAGESISWTIMGADGSLIQDIAAENARLEKDNSRLRSKLTLCLAQLQKCRQDSIPHTSE